MSPLHRIRPLKYRSIWISDIHLGSRDCRADFLLDFLNAHDTQYLYLIGDIVDLWAMNRSAYWPARHGEVVHTILDKASLGTKVIYIPGNHDDPLRRYMGRVFGNVEIHREYVHTTADGRRLLLLHGDEFDGVVQCGRIASFLGTQGYDILMAVNRMTNFMRRKFGFPYWSVATYLKHKVKNAVKHIRNFEEAVAHEAHKREVDGVICGHIHHPSIGTLNGVLYCNDGDWVENCTALAERHDGSLELLRWADEKRTVESLSLVTPCEATDQVA